MSNAKPIGRAPLNPNIKRYRRQIGVVKVGARLYLELQILGPADGEATDLLEPQDVIELASALKAIGEAVGNWRAQDPTERS